MTKDQINTLCLDLAKSIQRSVEEEMPTWHLDLTTGDAAEASYKVMMQYINEYVRLYVTEVVTALLADED